MSQPLASSPATSTVTAAQRQHAYARAQMEPQHIYNQHLYNHVCTANKEQAGRCGIMEKYYEASAPAGGGGACDGGSGLHSLDGLTVRLHDFNWSPVLLPTKGHPHLRPAALCVLGDEPIRLRNQQRRAVLCVVEQAGHLLHVTLDHRLAPIRARERRGRRQQLRRMAQAGCLANLTKVREAFLVQRDALDLRRRCKCG